jgi:Tfp pilus assembly protein PilN
VTAQRSKVEVIMNNDLLTRRIEELSTKRLLPFEMLDVISSKKPTSIWFTKVTTTDLYDITVEATTQDSASLASFETALNALNLFNSVQLKVTDSRGATTKFRLQASFKPGAVKAAQ